MIVGKRARQFRVSVIPAVRAVVGEVFDDEHDDDLDD